MLYSLFFYQNKTGLLLWEKSFGSELNEKTELISSFFSAIQNFLKELILDGSFQQESKGLQAIDMGNYSISITDIPELEIDVVVITDKNQVKIAKKFVSKIIKLLKEEHKEIFFDWDGDLGRFNVLDLEILRILQNYKDLMGSSGKFLEESNEIMDDIIEQMPELELEQRSHYLDELNFLDEKLNNSKNIFKKIELMNSKQTILQKLKEKEKIKKIQQEKFKMLSELDNTKQKLSYYLTQTKQYISDVVQNSYGKGLYDIDYKNAYMNLYSFSSKLKQIGNDELSKKYYDIANILLKKPTNQKETFSNIITDILNLSDNVDSYIIEE